MDGFLSKAKGMENIFVQKSLYSLTNLFKAAKPAVSFGGEGKGFKIKWSYLKEYEKEDEKFFLGDVDGENGPTDPSKTGILFNPSFRKEFINAGYESLNKIITSNGLKNLNSEEGEETGNKIKDLLEGSTFGFIFSFNKITYVPNVKPTKLNNPNYVKGLSGGVYFYFKGDAGRLMVKVGTIDWDQKRTKNMDPPKPIRQQIKERWANAEKTQTGMIGFAAAKILGGVAGGLSKTLGLSSGLSEVVQEESLDISIDDQFYFNNNQLKADDLNEVYSGKFNTFYDLLNSEFKIDEIEIEQDDGRGPKSKLYIFKYNDDELFTLQVTLK